VSSFTQLSDPKVCIVFAYAPAGLGHLRVSFALRQGLPDSVDPLLLPDRTGSVSFLHRLTSTTTIGKKILEWSQYGVGEDLFTKLYRKMLRSDAKELEEKLFEIYKQRVTVPTTLLIVCTHFGIAHQVSVIKNRLEKRAGVKILLVVQVTDDSPQKMWYVPNADRIFVPSLQTKKALRLYAKGERLADSKLSVIPYPISPTLCEALLPAAWKHKLSQFDDQDDTPITISVPISGAGVGTSFATAIMKYLHKTSKRYRFQVVGKRTWYTELFLKSLESRDYVNVYSSHSDRQIVEQYELSFQEAILSFEITKPSEQAFKCLLSPRQLGGVILLFTEPVGRQEYDNLDFLRRHELIPTELEQSMLWEASQKDWKSSQPAVTDLLERSNQWRGMKLPLDPQAASTFISWGYRQGIWKRMLKATPCIDPNQECQEIGDTGVSLFWEQIEKQL